MNKDYEQIGVIGVDAGLCWIGDPCYCVTPDATNHPAQTWSAFCGLLHFNNGGQQFNFGTGHAGLGICVSTGYGDGCYPVFIKKNSEGRVTEVKVVFEESLVAD